MKIIFLYRIDYSRCSMKRRYVNMLFCFNICELVFFRGGSCFFHDGLWGGSSFFLTVFGGGSWKNMTRIVKFSLFLRPAKQGAALISDTVFGESRHFRTPVRGGSQIFGTRRSDKTPALPPVKNDRSLKQVVQNIRSSFLAKLNKHNVVHRFSVFSGTVGVWGIIINLLAQFSQTYEAL